ncbi:MAG: hypothetical protein ACREEB_17905 [Caulobacteraceae bacterium]
MQPAVKLSLIGLQGLQVAFLLLHDWIPLGRLSNLEAVRASDPAGKLLLVTVVSALPFAAVFAVSCAYWTGPWPMWLRIWLTLTYIAAVFGAIQAWWGPYLLWGSPERARRYEVRFAGTLKFLPERHGIAPDVLHVAFHCCVLATVILSLVP